VVNVILPTSTEDISQFMQNWYLEAATIGNVDSLVNRNLVNSPYKNQQSGTYLVISNEGLNF
jgi:hypothetical protein